MFLVVSFNGSRLVLCVCLQNLQACKLVFGAFVMAVLAAGGTFLRIRSSAGASTTHSGAMHCAEASSVHTSQGFKGLSRDQLVDVQHILELMLDCLRPQLVKAKEKKEKAVLGESQATGAFTDGFSEEEVALPDRQIAMFQASCAD